MSTALIFQEETYKIIGACFEVYKEKGCGFLEAVYQECLEMELNLQGINYAPKKILPLQYKGRALASVYSPDLICYDKIIVELKAVAKICDEHRAQVQNYLRATGFQVGLLVNFGHFPKLEYERIVSGQGRYSGTPQEISF
jgi:GxxExxY protein